MKPALVIHGGAGKVRVKKSVANMLKKSVETGYDILLSGGSAIDAVEKCVVIMENSSCFNAGYGSYPRLDGKIKTDAAIMDSNLNCGAVCGLGGIKNPIKLCRLIMERSDHILFTEEGALKLAKMWGIKKAVLMSPRRKKRWEKARKDIKEGKTVSSYFSRIQDYIEKFGTVGAVAVDKDGLIATATSTGGIFLQLPGRVGDTPLIGCGTFTDEWGGCSATGHGEGIIRLALAKEAVMLMKNMTALQAMRAIHRKAKKLGIMCGAIAMDNKARIGLDFTTKGMNWAYIDRNGKYASYDRT